MTPLRDTRQAFYVPRYPWREDESFLETRVKKNDSTEDLLTVGVTTSEQGQLDCWTKAAKTVLSYPCPAHRLVPRERKRDIRIFYSGVLERSWEL